MKRVPLTAVLALTALAFCSACALSVAAQEPGQQVRIIEINMREWGNATPAALDQFLASQGLGPDDRPLLYLHGGLTQTTESVRRDDIPWAIERAQNGGYSVVVVPQFNPPSVPDFLLGDIGFSWEQFAFRLANPSPSDVEGTLRVADSVLRLTESQRLSAIGYSAGAQLAREAVALPGYPSVRFDDVVLLAMPCGVLGVSCGPVSQLDQQRAGRIHHVFGRTDFLLPRAIEDADTNSVGEFGHLGVVNPNAEAGRAAGSLVDQVLNPGGTAPNLPDVDTLPPPVLDDPRHLLHFFPPGGGGGGSMASPFLTGDRSSLPQDVGGVDFSSLELNYFAESVGSEFTISGYAFKATEAEVGEDPIVLEGEAELSSDAFFVWLALPNATFRVNLNPGEPDDIVDASLGSTDIGRILLEADFEMKKTVADLIHPDSATGTEFWTALEDKTGAQDDQCFSFRQWIVPGQVNAWKTADSIYIQDAQLDVKMESEYFELMGAEAVAACPEGESDIQDEAEETFRSIVLPELVERVNMAPEYHGLRNVFHSLIVAEWYKDRHADQGTYAALIGTGDVTEWQSEVAWDPMDTFDDFVESFTQGEFDETRGNSRYFFGGVDFSSVDTTDVSYADLEAQEPEVERQVFEALFTETGFQDESDSWLGGLHVVSPGAAGPPLVAQPEPTVPQSAPPSETQSVPESEDGGGIPWVSGTIAFILGAATAALLLTRLRGPLTPALEPVFRAGRRLRDTMYPPPVTGRPDAPPTSVPGTPPAASSPAPPTSSPAPPASSPPPPASPPAPAPPTSGAADSPRRVRIVDEDPPSPGIRVVEDEEEDS